MSTILHRLLLIPCALAAFAAEPVNLTLTVGRGTVIDCPQGIERIATSSPEVVDAVAASAKEAILQAKALGQATLVVWSKTGDRTVYNVAVEPDLEPLRKLLRETFPSDQIDVRATRDSLALVGHAGSQAVADRALALVAASVKGAISNLDVMAPLPARQVLLRVRFAELDRSASTEFGMSLLSTGAANTPGRITTGQFGAPNLSTVKGSIPGGTAGASTTFTLSDALNIFAFRPDLNLGLMIRDFQSRGLLQILAEPNLVATNGHEASFLAGGEFPVPIAQGGANSGAISVQFREFGIRLSFTPQVTAYGTIKLHVKPEVSTIDPTNGITVSGFNIPALITRRVETDIELGEGQSFAIAGLIDDRVTEGLSRMPGLARIPLLGALFRSRAETKSKTELIVVVTPETALPAPGRGPELHMPKSFLETPKQ